MDVDSKGMSNQVHLVINLRFLDTKISCVITQGDFSQIGKLENIVNPTDCGAKVIKI